MKRSTIALLSMVLTVLSNATAEVQPELHPYAKQLEPAGDASADSRFGACAIDEDIYAVLNGDQSNLRIVDDKGTEVPFLIRTKTGDRTIEQSNPIPYEKLSFGKPAENAIEIELRRSSDQRFLNRKASTVVLASGLRHFEKHVSVYCGNDGIKWMLLAENKPIFDYSRFIDIRNSRVSFPPADAEFFKLHISNISEKQDSPYTRLSRTMHAGTESSSTESTSFTRADFKIDEITFYETTKRTVKGKVLPQSYKASNFSITEEDKQSLVTFATANTPLTAISLLTPDSLFHRGFTLDNSDDGKSWRRIQAGTISCAGEGSEARESRVIKLPRAMRASFWRVAIQNNDSPPLDISGVDL